MRCTSRSWRSGSATERMRRGPSEGAATCARRAQRLWRRRSRSWTCELPREVSDHYRALRHGGIRLFPRAIEVLEALRGRGHRLGLVTNGTQAEQRGKIEQFDLEGHFELIQIEGSLASKSRTTRRITRPRANGRGGRVHVVRGRQHRVGCIGTTAARYVRGGGGRARSGTALGISARAGPGDSQHRGVAIGDNHSPRSQRSDGIDRTAR